jgi:RecA-family ATPase
MPDMDVGQPAYGHADTPGVEGDPEKLSILRGGELIQTYPEMKEPLVDGMLRRGETCNLIAAPKVGKSWLSLGLAVCVATGQDWLGYPVRASKVLVVDNELHPETLSHRFTKVAYGHGVEPDGCDVYFQSLRGKLTDINRLRSLFDEIGRQFDLIILDAKYRFQLLRASENANSDEAHFYNVLDRYAAQADAAIVAIHHATKGDQSQKSVTDVGAGAGAQSRAADTHLVIRPHQTEGLFVLDGVTRSFPPLESMSIQLQWPVWRRADEEEPILKQPVSTQERKQSVKDLEATRQLREIFQVNSEVTSKLVRKRTGWGAERANRLLAKMLQTSQIRILREDQHPNGSPFEVYGLNHSDDEEAGLDLPF